jgi:hypothetical protein
MTTWTCRQWEEVQEGNPNTSTFENWIKDVVRNHHVDPNDEDDMDMVMMCSRPSRLATRYTRMKAYGNHFRVEDPQSMALKTYDSGVASVFHMPSVGSEEVTLNYVGVLKDIFKLDYGPLRTPVILLRCEWMKQFDNRGNPTYVRDEAGFMVVNFRHKVPQMLDPFIFPSQATQVFWSDEVRKPGWKVVLAKEARSQRHEQSTQDVFMTTSEETDGMQLANHVPPPPTTASLVGAIELSDSDNSLALAKF